MIPSCGTSTDPAIGNNRFPELFIAIWSVCDSQKKYFCKKQHRKANELMRIMVVDDNAINRFVVRHLMEKRGHHIIEAESGEAALEALSEKQIDFVLMDLRMPGMDGFETVRRYRSSKKHLPQIPIIALTSQNTQECRDRSIAVGINGLIAKPFDVSSIEYAIELIQKNGDLATLQSR
jgi:two-component system sensor histidine kinase RpfC